MSAGYVTFEVGGVGFAVEVQEVREVVRAGAVRLLPSSDRTLAGRPVALADTGRSARPVLDLRADPAGPGDVLLARADGVAGLVVDCVSAVLRPAEVALEAVDEAALPSYAVGVLRAADGGAPRLLVSLPQVAHAALRRAAEPALGEPLRA